MAMLPAHLYRTTVCQTLKSSSFDRISSPPLPWRFSTVSTSVASVGPFAAMVTGVLGYGFFWNFQRPFNTLAGWRR